MPTTGLFANPCKMCSRVSGEDTSPERPTGVEGSQRDANPCKMCRSKKFARNPFRMRTSKTKDLKSFRIRTYEKNLYLSPSTSSLLITSCSSPVRGKLASQTMPDEPANDAGKLFDEYAKSYELALSTALAPSGEGREYFAEGRVCWLKRCLTASGQAPKSILDFGCGDGSTTPLLQRELNAEACTGVDVSPKSLEVAREHFATNHIQYKLIDDLKGEPQFDLAYCNGVFHHIPLDSRVDAAAIIRKSLKPGGLFSFWENNAWNPATRYVVSRCPFDKDAILLSPFEARSLLRKAGFEILRTDYRFIFPHALRGLRSIEDVVYKLPLGAQFQILCRKPKEVA
jgi:SAM-dependent methyltransferase